MPSAQQPLPVPPPFLPLGVSCKRMTCAGPGQNDHLSVPHPPDGTHHERPFSCIQMIGRTAETAWKQFGLSFCLIVIHHDIISLSAVIRDSERFVHDSCSCHGGRRSSVHNRSRFQKPDIPYIFDTGVSIYSDHRACGESSATLNSTVAQLFLSY